MRTAVPPCTSPPLGKRSLALVVAVAILVVQALGLLHRIAHSGHLHEPIGLAAAAAFDPIHAAASADHGPSGDVARTLAAAAWVQALFEGHEAQDCAAFDQLTHADVAFGAAFGTTVIVPPDDASRIHSAWHVAAQAHGFLARGPPAVS